MNSDDIDTVPEVIALIDEEVDDGRSNECDRIFQVPDEDNKAFSWLLEALHDLADINDGSEWAENAAGALRFIKALVDHDNKLHVELDKLEGDLIRRARRAAGGN